MELVLEDTWRVVRQKGTQTELVDLESASHAAVFREDNQPQSIILEDWVRFNQQAVCTTTTKLISSFMLMIVTPHIQGPLPHSVSKPDTNRKPPTVEPKLAACRRFLSPVALSCMQLDT
jgi:hypothetical protein